MTGATIIGKLHYDFGKGSHLEKADHLPRISSDLGMTGMQ